MFESTNAHRRGDEDIVFSLHDGTDSDNGLGFCEDSLVYPDFEPKSETFGTKAAEADSAIDFRMETLKKVMKALSPTRKLISQT